MIFVVSRIQVLPKMRFLPGRIGKPEDELKPYQAVEQGDLRRWASLFVTPVYCMWASFLRIRPTPSVTPLG